jgi:hypothetical protein
MLSARREGGSVRVGALVFGVAGVALHPDPFDRVAPCRGFEPLPQIDIASQLRYPRLHPACSQAACQDLTSNDRLAMHDDKGLQTCRKGTFAVEYGNDGVASMIGIGGESGRGYA